MGIKQILIEFFAIDKVKNPIKPIFTSIPADCPHASIEIPLANRTASG